MVMATHTAKSLRDVVTGILCCSALNSTAKDRYCCLYVTDYSSFSLAGYLSHLCVCLLTRVTQLHVDLDAQIY